MNEPRPHRAEPVNGSQFRPSGGVVNLLDPDHYPLLGICRVCQQTIRIEALRNACWLHVAP